MVRTRWLRRPQPEWKNAVLHARMEIGDTILLGADVPPERFQPMRSTYLTLMLDSIAEAERIYALLSDGGEIFMPMEETFYATVWLLVKGVDVERWEAKAAALA